MKHFLRTPYWQLKLPTAINGLNGKFLLLWARFHNKPLRLFYFFLRYQENKKNTPATLVEEKSL